MHVPLILKIPHMCFLQYSSVHRGMSDLDGRLCCAFAERARLRLTEMILIRDERDTDRRKAHVDVITSNHRDRARNYPNTRRRETFVYLSSATWKERNFLKETRVQNKYYTRTNASNNIGLFSSEISNNSPLYSWHFRVKRWYSLRERGR